MPDTEDPIARQSVRGSFYSASASAVTLSLGLLRSILLARLLNPEHFGLAALAFFFVRIVSQLRDLGMDAAIIHRQNVGEQVLPTYFTARVGTSIAGAALLTGLAPVIGRFYPEMTGLPEVILAYMAIGLLSTLNTFQWTALSRDLAFREMALTDVFASACMTLVAPYLAWRGWGVWSLVAELGSGVLARGLAVWFPFRRWRPQLGWNPQVARWLWGFGVPSWLEGNLTQLLDTFDDFWTGTTLGQSALGFYSRAYEFARYPRRVIANPILAVFFPAYARLQDDRLRLSRAFFRATSAMLRLGGWIALLLALSAPELIRLLIGSRWSPMTLTFQLMIVYTLLDPLALSAGNLLLATGHPRLILRTRLFQTLVFLPAVILLAGAYGTSGVALAADLMVLTGTILLFRHCRQVVDYNPLVLWRWPLFAMVVTTMVVLLAGRVWDPGSALIRLGVKVSLASAVYLGILALAEREQLVSGGKMIWGLLRNS